MRRILVAVMAGAACLIAAPAALATTQTAQSGNVMATFTFQGKFPNYHGLRIAIAQGGTVFYDQGIVSKWCGKFCAPASASGPETSVHVLDLEDDGQPDVLLDLYSGGAHCCWIEEIFSFDPGTMTYVMSERDFGDPGEEVVDLRHDGHREFLTADDSFAYAFTDYAASGLPIQILTFSGRHFRDVTREYPQLIARDAARWLKAFKAMARSHYQDSVGLIAAWAADETRLGHYGLVKRYLAQQAKLGRLNSGLSPVQAGGHRFVVKLEHFLRRHGYLG